MHILGLAADDPSYIDYKDGLDALRNNMTKTEYLTHKLIFMKCFNKLIERGYDSVADAQKCHEKAGLK